VSLKGQKPLSQNYPNILSSLGDHIRKRRLDLGLLQKEIAQEIGVTKDTIYLWESNTTTPAIRYMPKIIQFLGYAPYLTLCQSLSERLKMCRTHLGMSQEQLAKTLGVDVSTLAKWERGESQPTERSLQLIEAFLAIPRIRISEE
jgi:transcriptional regulator with XRE-family HTH domain